MKHHFFLTSRFQYQEAIFFILTLKYWGFPGVSNYEESEILPYLQGKLPQFSCGSWESDKESFNLQH